MSRACAYLDMRCLARCNSDISSLSTKHLVPTQKFSRYSAQSMFFTLVFHSWPQLICNTLLTNCQIWNKIYRARKCILFQANTEDPPAVVWSVSSYHVYLIPHCNTSAILKKTWPDLFVPRWSGGGLCCSRWDRHLLCLDQLLHVSQSPHLPLPVSLGEEGQSVHGPVQLTVHRHHPTTQHTLLKPLDQFIKLTQRRLQNRLNLRNCIAKWELKI